eukprot:g1343.t1
MGGNDVAATLLPMRFMALLAHLFCTVLVSKDKDVHVEVTIQPFRAAELVQQDTLDANSAFDRTLALTYVCFAIEFAGLFLGISMFRADFAMASALLHICGTVLVFWFAMEGWRYTVFISFFFVFNLLPAMPELVFAFLWLLQYLRLEKRLDIKLG